jgi:hypothetical protein
MFCKSCGQQMDDFALACPKCGAATTSQTQAPPPPPPPPQYQQPTYQQPQYQQPAYQQPQYQQPYQAQPVADVASGGIKFLAFCFPIVGLILYFVWKDQKPITAKAVIKLAIIGFVVVNIIPTIIYIILIAAGVFATSTYDYYSYYQIADFASRFFG